MPGSAAVDPSQPAFSLRSRCLRWCATFQTSGEYLKDANLGLAGKKPDRCRHHWRMFRPTGTGHIRAERWPSGCQPCAIARSVPPSVARTTCLAIGIPRVELNPAFALLPPSPGFGATSRRGEPCLKFGVRGTSPFAKATEDRLPLRIGIGCLSDPAGVDEGGFFGKMSRLMILPI